MSIISISFFSFYIVALIIYWSLSSRFKNLFLLLASWLFLATWSPFNLLFLITVIIIASFVGKKSATVKLKTAVGVILIVLLLAIVKSYTNIIQVLGISFFSFQALSYIIDVYRKDIEPEENIINLALYISFFPQLLSGPISKAKEQIVQYKEIKKFDYSEIKKSFVLIIYGCFMKMVIADRISIFVNSVYGNIDICGAYTIIVAIILYSVQIYCDFAGYSLIAVGIGRSFGINLPINFMQPYFAVSINDFWKRWHISLTSWFRDYLYFPLGGNRKGTIRTYLNILIVFIVSGLWHGIGITFFVWGFFHGAFQILERLIHRTKKFSRIFCFIIVSLLWVLFKSSTMKQAIEIYSSVIINTHSFEKIFVMGLDIADFIVIALSILIVGAIDLLKYKYASDIINGLFEKKLITRWILIYILLFLVLIFGIYGPGYDASSFIYTNF